MLFEHTWVPNSYEQWGVCSPKMRSNGEIKRIHSDLEIHCHQGIHCKIELIGVLATEGQSLVPKYC